MKGVHRFLTESTFYRCPLKEGRVNENYLSICEELFSRWGFLPKNKCRGYRKLKVWFSACLARQAGNLIKAALSLFRIAALTQFSHIRRKIITHT